MALARTRWKDDGGGQRPVEIAADLEAVSAVRGDRAALRDAVGHLVRNALDAMPGGGRLVLTLRPRDGGVELVVEDTGEGVGEEVRRRMFDPFFTTRAPARMGLGLTMVRSAVSRCGGRVDVSPGTGGRGTAVSVWLPAPSGAVPASGAGATEALAGPGEAARPAPVRQEPGGIPDPGAVPRREARASILVLEDEEPVRAMLVQALTEAGHEVHAAPDGPAGLAKIELGTLRRRAHRSGAARALGPRRRALRQAREPADPRRPHHGLGAPPRSRAAPRARCRPHARQAVPRRAGDRGGERGAPAPRLRLTPTGRARPGLPIIREPLF